MPDRDRFNDEYDPESDYDRPRSNAEAAADEAGMPVRDEAWVASQKALHHAERYGLGAQGKTLAGELEDDEDDEYTDRLCPVCGVDILGNDPHDADCPVEGAEREGEDG